jgi:DNA (cytosine-5)-methyltransferase 3A
MPKADRDTITQALGVEPIRIDAALVSAQSRKRLFWTNLPVSQPADRGILLKDILQPDAEVDDAMTTKGKAFCLTASYYKGGEGQWEYEHNKARKQRTMVYTVQGIGRPVVLGDSPLQVLKEGRTELGKQSRKEIREQTGKDSTSRSAGHKAYFGREGTKANCLTTSLGAENLIVKESVIRKLTPIECERLQGLPDDYTAGVAKTHRYKAVGNAFNVDVVAHILSSIHASQPTPASQDL